MDNRCKLSAELSPWTGDRAGVGFGVSVLSINSGFVELEPCDRIALGQQYLLEIPRPGCKALSEVCTVTRTGELIRAEFETPLADDDYRELSARLKGSDAPRVTSRLTQTLFIVFGIVGLVIAMLINW